MRGNPRTAEGRGPVWYLLDQVVISGTRFMLGWTLARWGHPIAFGAYTIAQSIVLVIEIAQQSLVTWPLAVLGTAERGENLRRYVKSMLLVQVTLAGSLSVAVGVGLLWLPPAWTSPEVRSCLWVTPLAILGFQGQEFFRRVLLSTSRIGSAVLNDCVLCGLQLAIVAGLGLVTYRGSAAGDPWLSAKQVLSIMGGCGVLATGLGVWQVRDLLRGGSAQMRAAFWKSWSFGRWILGSRFGEGLLSHANNFLMAGLGGAVATAALEGPRLLLAPVQVSATGLVNFLLSSGAEVRDHHGPLALRSFVVRASALGGLAFVAYAGLIAAFPGFWLRLFFSGRYENITALLLWAVCYALSGVRTIASTLLYLHERSDLVMHGMLGAGGLGLAVSVPLALAFGTSGAVGGRLVGEAFLLSWTIVWGLRVGGARGVGAPTS